MRSTPNWKPSKIDIYFARIYFIYSIKCSQPDYVVLVVIFDGVIKSLLQPHTLLRGFQWGHCASPALICISCDRLVWKPVSHLYLPAGVDLVVEKTLSNLMCTKYGYVRVFVYGGRCIKESEIEGGGGGTGVE